jgi:hypothetical protein
MFEVGEVSFGEVLGFGLDSHSFAFCKRRADALSGGVDTLERNLAPSHVAILRMPFRMWRDGARTD